MAYKEPEYSPTWTDEDGRQYCKATKKRAFLSQKQAETALNKMHNKTKKRKWSKRRTSEKKVACRFYKCEYCRYWHLTSMNESEYEEIK